MKKYFLNFLSIFKNKKDTKIYSIQELNELRQREKKFDQGENLENTSQIETKSKNNGLKKLIESPKKYLK